MNCSLKCVRHKNTPFSCAHIEILQVVRRFPVIKFLTTEKTFSMCGTQSGDIWKRCRPIRLLGSEYYESCESYGVSGFSGHPWYPVATGFTVLMNNWASLCHTWELDAASGLDFWFVLAPSFPDHPTCRLEALSIPRLLDAIGLFTNEELVGTELIRFIAVGLDFATILFSSVCSCTIFAIFSVQPNQAEILGTAERTEMADVEQTKKIVPLVTCEVSLCQYVCDLVFGVNVSDLNLGVQVDSVKQPIKRNSVGSWHMSHSWTPAFDDHPDHCLDFFKHVQLRHGFIVLKHVQHSNGLRKSDIRRHIVNMKQFRTNVHGWNFGLILLACAWGDTMPQVSLCWWIHGLIGFVMVMEHFFHQIPKIQSWDTV